MFSWKKILPLVRIPLLYGILGAVLSLTSVILFFKFGRHPFYINPVFDLRILLSGILLFFALREVRDYFFGGIMFLWQGMGGCLVYFATLAVVCAIGLYAFGQYDNSFLTEYQRQGLEQISKFNPDAIKQIGQQAVEELQKTLPTVTLTDLIKKYTFQTFVIGLFVTIIISVILRRQPKTN